MLEKLRHPGLTKELLSNNSSNKKNKIDEEQIAHALLRNLTSGTAAKPITVSRYTPTYIELMLDVANKTETKKIKKNYISLIDRNLGQHGYEKIQILDLLFHEIQTMTKDEPES